MALLPLCNRNTRLAEGYDFQWSLSFLQIFIFLFRPLSVKTQLCASALLLPKICRFPRRASKRAMGFCPF